MEVKTVNVNGVVLRGNDGDKLIISQFIFLNYYICFLKLNINIF